MPRCYLPACPRSPDFPRCRAKRIATVRPATLCHERYGIFRAAQNNTARFQNDALLTPSSTVRHASSPSCQPTLHEEAVMLLRANDRQTLAPVTTILTPAERVRVDAAGEGLYTALHRD